MIDESLKTMKENDLYSLILYAIYKGTKDPKYSTLCELIYTLDRESLMKLCSIFGGCTIKIPTIDQLKVYSSGLLVYNLINEGYTLKAALNTTGLDTNRYSEVLDIYHTIEEVIKEYEGK